MRPNPWQELTLLNAPADAAGERLYTAEEIGAKFGMSADEVMAIAAGSVSLAIPDMVGGSRRILLLTSLPRNGSRQNGADSAQMSSLYCARSTGR